MPIRVHINSNFIVDFLQVFKEYIKPKKQPQLYYDVTLVGKLENSYSQTDYENNGRYHMRL